MQVRGVQSPAMSAIFCPHGKVKTTCAICRPNQPPTDPAEWTASLSEHWHLPWHAFRRACHRRIRDLLVRQRTYGATEATFEAVYGKPPGGGKTSENEGRTDFRGQFYLAFVKMIDASSGLTRFATYNSEATWTSLIIELDRIGADGLPRALEDGRLRIHGGNGAWSHQQRPGDFWSHPGLERTVQAICFGRDSTTPDGLPDDAAAHRVQECLSDPGLELRPTLSLCSKLFHIFDPLRWPVLNVRANAAILGTMGVAVIQPRTGRQYVRYAEALRAYATKEALPDLEMVDVLCSNAYKEFMGKRGPG